MAKEGLDACLLISIFIPSPSLTHSFLPSQRLTYSCAMPFLSYSDQARQTPFLSVISEGVSACLSASLFILSPISLHELPSHCLTYKCETLLELSSVHAAYMEDLSPEITGVEAGLNGSAFKLPPIFFHSLPFHSLT